MPPACLASAFFLIGRNPTSGYDPLSRPEVSVVLALHIAVSITVAAIWSSSEVWIVDNHVIVVNPFHEHRMPSDSTVSQRTSMLGLTLIEAQNGIHVRCFGLEQSFLMVLGGGGIDVAILRAHFESQRAGSPDSYKRVLRPPSKYLVFLTLGWVAYVTWLLTG